MKRKKIINSNLTLIMDVKIRSRFEGERIRGKGGKRRNCYTRQKEIKKIESNNEEKTKERTVV